MTEWEKVHETSNAVVSECLHRIKVPNGYLYRSLIFSHKIESQSMCFVPDADALDIENLRERIERIEAHLVL
jgi:hypothetical protein